MSQTLEQFQAYQTRLEQYDQAIALLYWDLQTAAPKDSIEAKLSAVGYFSTESFRLSTADEYGSLLHGICHRKGTFRKSLGGSQGGF